MKRHVLAGFFGHLDQITVPSAADEQVTLLDLVATGHILNHGISQALGSLNALSVFPTEIGMDLLIVAAHVHAADTRISRTEQSQDSWTREIRLVVPVSDPERWGGACHTLTRCLNFLTGDLWTIGFRQRPQAFRETSRRRATLFPPDFDSVSLFSGGLDSLIGAINLLESGRTPLLVSHAGDSATSEAQSVLFDKLKAHYHRSSLNRLRVRMTFPNALVTNVNSENTTRGRSFLFFALGVFAACGLGTPFVLLVPENGLIALNVPLDLLRLGSNSTRTTHPFYMARWNELLSQLGIDGRVENPYWDKTKGEMVAGCATSLVLQELVGDSLSCSSPSKGRWNGRGIEHCGYCLPCLIRRAALDAGWGRGTDPTIYTMSDLAKAPLSTQESVGKQVRSFQVAIERLRRNPNLAKALIHKPGPLTDVKSDLARLAYVYMRGLNEVGQLLQGVQTTNA